MSGLRELKKFLFGWRCATWTIGDLIQFQTDDEKTKNAISATYEAAMQCSGDDDLLSSLTEYGTDVAMMRLRDEIKERAQKILHSNLQKSAVVSKK